MKTPLKEITIEWSESSRLKGGQTFTSFASASEALSLAARERKPYEGGYFKTSVVVTWQDGDTYQARIDLQHELHGHLANVVGDHIRSFCEFSCGRKKPPHMTAEDHEAYMRATDKYAPRESFARVLDGYALDDGMPTIDGKPPEKPAPVEKTAEEKRRDRGEGVKYSASRSLADVKRGIVADIKAAVEAGDLPKASYKVSAKRSRGSMCRPDLGVQVDGLPFTVMHPDKVRTMHEDGGYDHRYHGPWASDEAGKVRDKLQSILDAYGYDRSDIQTDYFDYAFNIDVSFASSGREWEAAKMEGERLAREKHEAQKSIDTRN